MDGHFREMREYIFETNDELIRFRQVVVNVVLATDIFDPDLNDLRKKRWDRAFSECGPSSETNNARATVVMEFIMQASDVCHTMQHWHVYKRFNQKLFEELMVAYRQGRCAANPTDFWYEGELKFFDNYVSYHFQQTHTHAHAHAHTHKCDGTTPFICFYNIHSRFSPLAFCRSFLWRTSSRNAIFLVSPVTSV